MSVWQVNQNILDQLLKDNFLFDTIIDWAVQFCTQISLPIILTDLIDEFMFW